MKYKNVEENMVVAVATKANDYWNRERGVVESKQPVEMGRGEIVVQLDSGKSITLNGSGDIWEWNHYQQELATENARLQKIKDADAEKAKRRAERKQREAEYEARPETIAMRKAMEAARIAREAEEQKAAEDREKRIAATQASVDQAAKDIAKAGITGIVTPQVQHDKDENYWGHGDEYSGEDAADKAREYGMFVLTADQVKALLNAKP